MNQYTENVLGAIDLIVQERMKDLRFDKTIICTIIEDKGNGLYMVSDGASSFEAISELATYPIQTQVNVLIPQGDYKNQKIITGRYIANSDEINRIKYVKPFDSCLIIEDGLILVEQEFSLLANDINFAEKEIYNQTFTTSYGGFTCLGIAADFLSLLSDYKITEGSYGLKIIINETTNTPIIYYFDSEDMYGNPYDFGTYFRQEKVFDISKIENISSIKVLFYQNNNFKYQNEIGDIDNVPTMIKNDFFDKDKEESMLSNLKSKNLEVFLGYDLSEFEEDTIILYSTNELTYNKNKTNTENLKNLKIRWIRKNKNTLYLFNEEDITENIKILWFKKDETVKKPLEGEKNEDYSEVAGEGWKLLKEQNNPMAYKNFLPDTAINKNIIKVIITEKDDKSNIKKYESNLLTFTSEIDNKTADLLTGLELNFIDDDYKGNYRVYNKEKIIKNKKEASKIRTLKPILRLGGVAHEVSSETGDIIKWEFSKTLTMFDVVNEIDDTNSSIVEFEADLFKYKIKENFLETHNNNTIKCTVTRNNEEYTKTITLNFGPSGATEKDYRLVIEPAEFDASGGIYTIGNNSENIRLGVKLYDYNDKVVEIEDKESIEWTWGNNENHIDNESLQKEEDGTVTISPAYNGVIPNIDDKLLDKKNPLFYNVVKATVKLGEKTFQKEKTIFKTDANGNYLDKDGNILNKDGDIIINKDLWFKDVTEDEKDKIATEKITINSENVPITISAYYGIPIRSSKEYVSIEGPTTITYNTSGSNPIFENTVYKIHKQEKNSDEDKIVENVEWKLIAPDGKDSSSYFPEIKTLWGKEHKISLCPIYVDSIYSEIAIVCCDKTNQNLLWAQPLIIQKEVGGSSSSVNWDTPLTTDKKNGTIISTTSGKTVENPDGTYSGIIIGEVEHENEQNKSYITTSGLYGYDHGQQTFRFTEDGTFLLGKISDEKKIEFNKVDEPSTSNKLKIDLNKGSLLIESEKLLIDSENEIPLKIGKDIQFKIDEIVIGEKLKLKLNTKGEICFNDNIFSYDTTNNYFTINGQQILTKDMINEDALKQ